MEPQLLMQAALPAQNSSWLGSGKEQLPLASTWHHAWEGWPPAAHRSTQEGEQAQGGSVGGWSQQRDAGVHH